MSNALKLIQEERRRQVEEEGWTEAHDDEHRHGQLSRAAACYAAAPDTIYRKRVAGRGPTFEDAWPWLPEWDKRDKHDRLRQLVIAGALIVAEIERLQRADL